MVDQVDHEVEEDDTEQEATVDQVEWRWRRKKRRRRQRLIRSSTRRRRREKEATADQVEQLGEDEEEEAPVATFATAWSAPVELAVLPMTQKQKL